MKYLSLSLITTGPDPVKNDVLEIGMIVEDSITKLSFNDCPKLRFWIDKEFYRGTSNYLVGLAPIFKKINKFRNDKIIGWKRLAEPDKVIGKFTHFLLPFFGDKGTFKNEQPIVVCGEHFNFYKQFLSKFKGFDNIPICNRILDPSNFFISWNKDICPPDINTLTVMMKKKTSPTDGTLEVCWNNIEILRTQY